MLTLFSCRRRVGKTFFVDHFFDRHYDFSFVGGHRLPKAKQLRNFAKSLKKYAHLQRQPLFDGWDDAFDYPPAPYIGSIQTIARLHADMQEAGKSVIEYRTICYSFTAPTMSSMVATV